MIDDDHAEAMQKLWQTAYTRECMDAQTIADLRAENERLLDEAYTARQAAKGENALRLEAERERDTVRAQLEEARNFVVDSECSCLPYASPEHGGMCERCLWLEETR